MIPDPIRDLLLQVAGAAAHQLNQPLMALLGSIDLMRLHREDPDKLVRDLARIEEAGRQIADIVRKIQTIQRYETKPYLDREVIVDLDQRMNMLFVVESDENFRRLETVATRQPRVRVARARKTGEAVDLLEKERFELILIDPASSGGVGLDLLGHLYEKGIDTPVVVTADTCEDAVASRLVAAGAYDCLPTGQMTDGAFNRVIANVQEKLRLQREVEELRRRLTRQAVTDERSGLFNHMFFMQILEREMSRARRYALDMVVALIELEKQSAAAPDPADAQDGAVLGILGRLLRRELRKSDFLCHYSPVSIAALFPQTHAVALGQRLESLRRRLGRQRFEHRGRPVRIGVHIGMCAFDPSAGQSARDYLARVEAALTVARQKGVVYALGNG